MDIEVGPDPVALSGKDLIAAGWESGPALGNALKQAKELLRTNPSLSYAEVIETLKATRPVVVPKLQLRNTPAPWTEAIEAKNDLEEANLTSVRQKMTELLRVPVIKRGAIMPDACPAGKETATIPVGGAVEVDRAIIPSCHSADICCSMSATFFHSDRPVRELMDYLQESTRFGPGGRRMGTYVHHPVLDEPVWDNPYLQGLQDYAARNMADQGDGNHFAYIGRIDFAPEAVKMLEAAGYEREARTAHDEGSLLTLVTHHGSRQFGAKIYKAGQLDAINATSKIADNIPDAGAWLSMDTKEGQDYWEALQYVARWTKANHDSIHQIFLRNIKAEPELRLQNQHNFVWQRGDSMYHGKGATPAWKDNADRPLLGLVPLNMAREILITLGNNNDEFLSFSPHGAGRNLSRTGLLKTLKDENGNIDESRVRDILAHETKGLDIRWFQGLPDLSESPLGYKNATQIKEQINQFGLSQVVSEIKPMGCIMAGGNPVDYREQRRLNKQRGYQADRRRVKQELKSFQGDE